MLKAKTELQTNIEGQLASIKKRIKAIETKLKESNVLESIQELKNDNKMLK